MVESKIKDLLENPQSVFVFDVDGVLAPIEYGEYNHYFYDDEKWATYLKTENPYQKVRPFKTMQEFIKKLNKENVYVITKVMNDLETEYKKDFVLKNYQIDQTHLFAVSNENDKVIILTEIKKRYPHLKDKYLIMIDDTVNVLNNVMEKSAFSTIHISSFLK